MVPEINKSSSTERSVILAAHVGPHFVRVKQPFILAKWLGNPQKKPETHICS